MVTTTDTPTEWIEMRTYRGRRIQRTYSDERFPFRVQSLSGRWMKKRTLPECRRYIDRILD